MDVRISQWLEARGFKMVRKHDNWDATESKKESE